MIELIDHNVGRMLDALERTGQADNTLVIFTSDHGEMLGDHGLLLKGCRFYEGLVHVPLILRWPGQIAAGTTTDALVELTDLAPTLLDAAGMAVPRHMAGRSLLPLLRGTATEHRCALRVLRGPEHGAPRPCRMVQLACHHDPQPPLQARGVPRPPDWRVVRPGERPARTRQPVGQRPARGDPLRLLRRCFDATAFAIDTGPEATRPHSTGPRPVAARRGVDFRHQKNPEYVRF